MQDDKNKEKNTDDNRSENPKIPRRSIKFQTVSNKTTKRTVSGVNRKLKSDAEQTNAAARDTNIDADSATGINRRKRTDNPVGKKKTVAGKQKTNQLKETVGKRRRKKGADEKDTAPKNGASRGIKSKGFAAKEAVEKRLNNGKAKITSIKQDARKAELFKKYLIAGAIALVVILLVVFLKACSGKPQKAETDSAATAESEVAERSFPASEVRHFSFGRLIADGMAGDNSVLTVSQFRQILQELYDANYILVDIYSLAEKQQNEDGSSAFTEASLEIPAGKIPFVLSQRDVNYSLDRIGKGYPSRLLLDENNQIVNEFLNADGTISYGAYDIVPILDEFIAEHPDFAYENARGVLGLTGYNGILGYRTSESLGKTMEEGNPFAVYGIYDVNAEIEVCKPVVEALKKEGWHFACFGNNYCSYGAEYAMMTSDLDAWMENVSDLIGGTDLMLFPCDTDIGNWSEYKEDNPKYQYLKEKGFNYFLIETTENPYWMQVRPGYVRQGIKEIEKYDDFAAVMGKS